MAYTFSIKRDNDGKLIPLDTTGWDIHVMSWRCVYEFKQRPEIDLLLSQVTFNFKVDISTQDQLKLETMVYDGSISQLPVTYGSLEFTWNIDKIIADAKGAGLDIMYFGISTETGVKSKFLVLTPITKQQKDKIEAYIKNLFQWQS